MKKTKLLAPLFGLATVVAVAAPMIACGSKATTEAGINLEYNAEYDLYMKTNVTGKKDDILTLKATVTDQGETLTTGYFAIMDNSESNDTPFTQYEIQSFVIGGVTLTKDTALGNNKYVVTESEVEFQLAQKPSKNTSIVIKIKLSADLPTKNNAFLDFTSL